MKVQVEIELPYIDEEGHIDDNMEQQLLGTLVNRIVPTIDKRINERVDAMLDDLISSRIEGIINDFLNKPVTVSNGYKKEEYASVIGMVEHKFSSLYETKFNQQGSCNGKDPILIEITRVIDDKVKRMLDSMGVTIEREAKNIATKAIQESSLHTALVNAGLVKDK